MQKAAFQAGKAGILMHRCGSVCRNRLPYSNLCLHTFPAQICVARPSDAEQRRLGELAENKKKAQTAFYGAG